MKAKHSYSFSVFTVRKQQHSWKRASVSIVTAAKVPAPSDTLSAGQVLVGGQFLESQNHDYEALYQGDGNFVLYGPGHTAIWSSATAGHSTGEVAMQADGNLVVYDANHTAVFSTGTNGMDNNRLSLQDDGNLVVYSRGGVPLWDPSSGRLPNAEDTLGAGFSLGVGQALWSSDDRYEALYQGDGNFVVYGPGGSAIWSSATAGHSTGEVAMQGDGNLVVYDANHTAVFSTGTTGNSNAYLAMQTDGNLVVYSSGHTALWDYSTGRLSPGNSTGSSIVAAAASQAGEPYCFDGGNTGGPTHGSGGAGCSGSTVGFDCSGLALYSVYQATGIVLPHYAASQATDSRGTFIASQSQLQPGDLVFFGGGSMSKAEHVGIYAGGGEMWDANDYNVPVQEHSLSWEESGSGGLAFDGGMRF